ncbi:MAG: DUF1289 domain-containing protein [Rhodospirillales bacterium]
MDVPSPVLSPCVGICVLDAETGLCCGCLRNGPEIGAWRDASEPQRREILRRVALRRHAGAHTSTTGPSIPSR